MEEDDKLKISANWASIKEIRVDGRVIKLPCVLIQAKEGLIPLVEEK